MCACADESNKYMRLNTRGPVPGLELGRRTLVSCGSLSHCLTKVHWYGCTVAPESNTITARATLSWLAYPINRCSTARAPVSTDT